MVHRALGRMIVDTLGRIVLVWIQGYRGGLRRIDKTCDMAVRPLMGGLSLVCTSAFEGPNRRGNVDSPFGFQADMMILLSVGLFLIVSTTLAN